MKLKHEQLVYKLEDVLALARYTAYGATTPLTIYYVCGYNFKIDEEILYKISSVYSYKNDTDTFCALYEEGLSITTLIPKEMLLGYLSFLEPDNYLHTIGHIAIGRDKEKEQLEAGNIVYTEEYENGKDDKK